MSLPSRTERAFASWLASTMPGGTCIFTAREGTQTRRAAPGGLNLLITCQGATSLEGEPSSTFNHLCELEFLLSVDAQPSDELTPQPLLDAAACLLNSLTNLSAAQAFLNAPAAGLVDSRAIAPFTLSYLSVSGSTSAPREGSPALAVSAQATVVLADL